MQFLLPLSVLLFACQPNFMKVDEANTNTDTNEPNDNEPSSDPVTDPDTPNEPDTVDPVEPDEDALRCCYFVQMQDFSGDGWQRGLLSVFQNDEIYANVTLPSGYDGFREVCLNRGSAVSFSWNPGIDNEDVAIVISDAMGDLLYYNEHPEAGVLLETVSECPNDWAVDSNYEEYDSTNEPDPTDPTDPTDPEDFSGDWIGLFELYHSGTGEQLCMIDMPVNINPNGTFTAQETCSVMGFPFNIHHTGMIYPEEIIGVGGSPDMNFGFATLSGTVEVSDISGILGLMSIEAEFYGECVIDEQFTYIYAYWDSILYPPNGGGYPVSAQLYVEY